MSKRSWLSGLLITVFLINPVLAGIAPTPYKEAKITVLYDAFSKDQELTKDWGYGTLVEIGGKRILFDTGNNGDILKHNATIKNIDLTKLDFVVLSHRHGDHMGGLDYLLSINPDVIVYAPKEGFGVYGGNLPSSFYPKDPTLPPEQRYFDGKPADVLHFGSAWPNAHIELIDTDTQIAPNIHLISQVSDKKGTLELKELSLAINTDNGVIILVGCSHSGVENIIATAAQINPKILWVGGGFHLIQGNPIEVNTVITALKDTYKVAYIAPGHCTGELTFSALQKAFGKQYLYAGLGTVFELGKNVKVIGDNHKHSGLSATDFADLKHYLLQSDDVEHIQLVQHQHSYSHTH